jgi:hypothetical protein
MEVSKQPGGELPPTHEAARTRDETILLHWWCPTVLVRVQLDITALPTSTPPTHRSPVPTGNDHPIHHLEPGHRTGPSSRLTTAPQPPHPDQDAPNTIIGHQVDGALKKNRRVAARSSLRHQHVDDLPELIDRPVQIDSSPSDLDVDLVINGEFCVILIGVRWIRCKRQGQTTYTESLRQS